MVRAEETLRRSWYRFAALLHIQRGYMIVWMILRLGSPASLASSPSGRLGVLLEGLCLWTQNRAYRKYFGIYMEMIYGS